MGKYNIDALLPQKKPFRFIDNILKYDENSITCVYEFTNKQEFYKGHFPNNPVTPGVILIEAMAQSALAHISLLNSSQNMGYLVKIENCSFHKLVLPSAKVFISTKKHTTISDFIVVKSKISNTAGEKVATCKLTLKIVNND